MDADRHTLDLEASAFQRRTRRCHVEGEEQCVRNDTRELAEPQVNHLDLRQVPSRDLLRRHLDQAESDGELVHRRSREPATTIVYHRRR